MSKVDLEKSIKGISIDSSTSNSQVHHKINTKQSNNQSTDKQSFNQSSNNHQIPKQTTYYNKKKNWTINSHKIIVNQYGSIPELSNEVSQKNFKKIDNINRVDNMKIQEKMLQNILRLKDQEYQNILIQQKELQLELLDKRSEEKRLFYEFKKQKHQVFEKKEQCERMEKQLNRKKIHLKKYHEHLEEKFTKKTPLTKHISEKIQKLDLMLSQKYQGEKKKREQMVQELEKQYEVLVKEVQSLSVQKIEVTKQIERHRKVLEQPSLRLSKNRKTLESKEQKKQLFYKLTNKIVQEKNKTQVINNQLKILNKILNIEEEHKRYSLIIDNGIKKLFRNKYRQVLYKNAVGQERAQKIPELKEIISKRKAEYVNLNNKLSNQEQQLITLKHKVDQLLIQYSQVENKVMIQKNKAK